MNGKAAIRVCLAALMAFVLATSVVRGDTGEANRALTLGKRFTLSELGERLPIVHFALYNPFYEGRLKVYRGFYLADIIRLVTSAEDGVVYFEARDGYKEKIEVAEALQNRDIVGLIAFEEIGAPAAFEPVVDDGGLVEDLGPFWLVWGHVDPSQVSDGGESLRDSRPWPWQLAEIWIE